MKSKSDKARSDWQMLLATNKDDPRMRYVLDAVLESVVVDIITNKMAASDEFAEVIGRRIKTMLDATAKPRSRKS